MKTKTILFTALALSAVLAASLNITSLLTHQDKILNLGQFLGTTNLTALSGFLNIALLIAIIIRYKVSKLNILWLFIPYLGSIIFLILLKIREGRMA